MMLTWMLSATMFTLIAGIAATTAERALRTVGRAGRVPWLLALGAGVVWPVLVPLLRQVGNAGATGSAVATAATLPAVHVFPDPVLGAMRWAAPLDLILAALWIATSCALLLRLVRGLHALRRAQRDGEQQTLDGVPVIISQTLGPAVAGGWRPRIIVPRWLLDLEEPFRALVLRHEQEHCRTGDHRLVQGAALATALVPWNPAAWWIARRLRLALEVDCDARVLRQDSSAEQYAKLLLLIAQRQSVTRLAPMLAASRSHLEGRILAMHTPRPSRPVGRLLPLGVVTALLVAAACASPIGDGPLAPNAKERSGMLLDVAVAGTLADSAQQPLSKDSIVDVVLELVLSDSGAEGILTRRATGGSNPANTTSPYFEYQVEKRVLTREGNPGPSYPPMLERARIEGEVLAQFVVDTAGKADMSTFKALKSTNDLFTASVTDVLPRMKFSAAEVGGRKVSQITNMPFIFKVPK